MARIVPSARDIYVAARDPGCPEQRVEAAAAAVRALRRAQEERPCPAWAAPVAEIDAWLKAAKAGERFVYCTGPVLVRGPAATRAAAIYRAGRAELKQQRRTDCAGFDFILEARRAPEAASGVPDKAALDILAALRRAAREGKRCPTNRDLARIAELPTQARASKRVALLAGRGTIQVDVVASGPDSGWRVVRFPDTGWETAPPPSRRAAR